MRKLFASLGSLIFFIVAPVTIDGLGPWWITGWQVQADWPLHGVLVVLGAVLIVAGAIVVVDAFVRFSLQGLGTPAPVFPTKHLVVRGFYRYVRNPIYVANTGILIGQALVFADWRLIVYAAIFWLGYHVFVLAYEEPTLHQTFAAEYDAFSANVPRWLPRLTPWNGAS